LRGGTVRKQVTELTLRDVGRGLAREFKVYRLILKDERTPRVARWLLGAAVAYALSPIDLIPDWVPILGHLDDLLIVPLVVWLGLRYVPREVVADCRAEVGRTESVAPATK
jgi:uncharacterized membrane protein YkvA (DUF1232 family)